MTELRKITVDNFDDIIALRVAPGQEGLCVENVESIAQAYVQPNCFPFAIYEGSTPVGFIMTCIDTDDGEWWLYRLMVDARHQGRGHGRSALQQAISNIQKDSERRRIYLGVDKSGQAAPVLYESLGFREDGRVYGKEHIMVLEW